jgi:hypothetical protein
MTNLMSNIFTKPEDYRVHFDGARYVVFVNTLYHCNLASKERVDTFLKDRLQPVEIPARVYEDICRCPKDIILWRYAVTKLAETDDLIWEVCKKCKMPLRHNVMLEINRGLIEDFDLEAFLGL